MTSKTPTEKKIKDRKCKCKGTVKMLCDGEFKCLRCGGFE